MENFLIILAIIGILWLFYSYIHITFSFLIYAFTQIGKCEDEDEDEIWSGNPAQLQCFYQKGITCRYYNSLGMVMERSCKECELYEKK